MDEVRLNEVIAPAYAPLHFDIKAMGHSEYWLKGGRGSGKSTFIAIEIVLGLLRDPMANAIVYRKVANTLRDSVYAQINWAIDRLGLGAYFKRGLSPLEIVYAPTGQRIVFRGADDPVKSKSIKLERGFFKFLWFEELTEFRGMDAVYVIKQSVIRGSDRAFTFYSYNPPRTRQNWTNAEAMLVKPDRLVHHSTYLDMPESWLGAAFLTEAQTLKQTNERAYAHAYLGEVTGSGGHVFDNVEIREISDGEIAVFDYFLNGLDFGFAVDPCALVRAAYSKRERALFLVDEFFAVRASNDALARQCARVCPTGVIVCDSADPRTIAELRERGVFCAGAKKGSDSVRFLINWLQDLAAIVIDPVRCPNAAREFALYEYAVDKYGNFMADFPDKDNHAIDAVRYAVSELAENRLAKTAPELRRYL
ncbi:MAG: PBSX family phage terminase large subunit [Clostridia bacterium]|nr:PBSX family phage terminase large subunit [Clostridia bacterium]